VALLERSSRKPFLPSFDELCRQTEATLHQAGGLDGQRVVQILLEIETKLDRHIALAGPAEKQILMLERAAARAVRADYQDKIRQHEAYAKAWNRGVTSASPLSSRITGSREIDNNEDKSTLRNHA